MPISEYITAARSPPRSDPANSQALRPIATPHSALRSVVAEAYAAVVEEAGECRPALEHVIYGLGGLGVARQPAPLGAHPVCKIADQWRDAVLAGSAPVTSGDPVEFTLDREDRVDAPHGFDRQRRFAGVGEDEEIATAMAPAQRLGDRPRPSLGIVELAEPGIGVGLEDSGIAGQMPAWMLTAAVARVIEDRSGRIRPAERPIVSDIRP